MMGSDVDAVDHIDGGRGLLSGKVTPLWSKSIILQLEYLQHYLTIIDHLC